MSEKRLISFEDLCESCLYHGVELKTRKGLCTKIGSPDGETRPESCPRWKKMIEDEEQIVRDFQKKLLENQKPLDPEIAKMMDDHLWDLVGGDDEGKDEKNQKK